MLRGTKAVLSSHDCNAENIFANILRVEVNHGQGAKDKLYILEKKPARASIFSRIFANTKVRRIAYILKEIRE